MRLRSRRSGIFFGFVLGAVALGLSLTARAESSYLFFWAWDFDKTHSDFLAVVDANPQSDAYGTILSTTPTGFVGWAHHTDLSMPEGGELLANAFEAGQTFRFDLTDPTTPRIVGSFKNAGPYTYPHTYYRLANRNILATFQNKGEGNTEPGGLVELDPQGAFLRGGDAAAPDVDPAIRPYSLELLSELDRVVTTTNAMNGDVHGTSIQIWRYSDLTLLKTLLLPPGPNGEENFNTAEPRLLPDGKSVYVNTFNCGLYLLSEVDSDEPTVEHLVTFPFAGTDPMWGCSLPALIDSYWIQAATTVESLIVLDISEPRRPRQIDELKLPDGYRPHWVSASPDGRRLIVTGGGALMHRAIIVDFDRETGHLTLDDTFREAGQDLPGISFEGPIWSHGATGAAVPHGAVFSRD